MLFIESRSVRGLIVYAMIVQAKHTNQTFQRLRTGIMKPTFPIRTKTENDCCKSRKRQNIGNRSRVSESWIQNSGIPLNSGTESSLILIADLGIAGRILLFQVTL